MEAISKDRHMSWEVFSLPLSLIVTWGVPTHVKHAAVPSESATARTRVAGLKSMSTTKTSLGMGGPPSAKTSLSRASDNPSQRKESKDEKEQIPTISEEIRKVAKTRNAIIKKKKQEKKGLTLIR